MERTQPWPHPGGSPREQRERFRPTTTMATTTAATPPPMSAHLNQLRRPRVVPSLSNKLLLQRSSIRMAPMHRQPASSYKYAIHTAGSPRFAIGLDRLPTNPIVPMAAGAGKPCSGTSRCLCDFEILITSQPVRDNFLYLHSGKLPARHRSASVL